MTISVEILYYATSVGLFIGIIAGSLISAAMWIVALKGRRET